ncbi:MAG: hypothetical protein AAB367_04665 [Patescibacteria group bacterium]
MNNTNDNTLNVQSLRAEAHRFFGRLKYELSTLEKDLDVLNHDLVALDGAGKKLAHDIEAIEDRAVEHMDRQLIDLLNDADREAAAA